MIRLWPNTLSSQMVSILFVGVTLALVSSATLHLQDRNQALSNFGGMQTAQHIATIVQLMDPLSKKERLKIAKIVETPLQYLRFLEANTSPLPDIPSDNSYENQVKIELTNHLEKHWSEKKWPLRIMVIGTNTPNSDEITIRPSNESPSTMRTMIHHSQHLHKMNQIIPQGVSFLAQVQLSDGIWAEFHNHLPRTVFTWSNHLLLSIVILFVVVTSLSFLAVRLTTKPLSILATAAQALGNDIHQPPLTLTSGPKEVRYASQAFNTMQARLVRYIQERTQLLAAISHDLKTPMTRMRLRIETLKDESVQVELLENLSEMEQMTLSALDYIRGMEGMEPFNKSDISSLLDKLQEIFQELGKEVTIVCDTLPPFPVMQKSLKRCLTNLLSNAVNYGNRATVHATHVNNQLIISITDEGPGIPEHEMERVFQPFVRLEDSRNRHTGGTGLGLSIARNIARAHSGDLILKNRPEGGLEVILTLPEAKKS